MFCARVKLRVFSQRLRIHQVARSSQQLPLHKNQFIPTSSHLVAAYFFLILVHVGDWRACARIKTLWGPLFLPRFAWSIGQMPPSSRWCLCTSSNSTSAHPSPPHTRLHIPTRLSATYIRPHTTHLCHTPPGTTLMDRILNPLSIISTCTAVFPCVDVAVWLYYTDSYATIKQRIGEEVITNNNLTGGNFKSCSSRLTNTIVHAAHVEPPFPAYCLAHVYYWHLFTFSHLSSLPRCVKTNSHRQIFIPPPVTLGRMYDIFLLRVDK